MAVLHTLMADLRNRKHLLEDTHHKDSSQISGIILQGQQSHNIHPKADLNLSISFLHHSKDNSQHKEEDHRTQTRALMTYTPPHPPEPMPMIQDDKLSPLTHEQLLPVE
jgi:hypothetical protein